MPGSGFNWKIIVTVLGFTLAIESLFLFLCAGVSSYYQEQDQIAFIVSGSITLGVGLIFLFFSRKQRVRTVSKREGFFTVTASWLLFCAFGMIPYCLSGDIPTLTDAFFETMSGLTTTGASTISDVEILSRGLLLWRSLTQWLGGMGVIVFSLALLPLMGGGAIHLYDAETTGITHDRFRPRVIQVAKRLWGIYLGLTLVCIVLLSVGPMDFFDAVCHAFSTMATGGYSTKQNSIAYYDSIYIEWVLVAFMWIASPLISTMQISLGLTNRLLRLEGVIAIIPSGSLQEILPP